MIDVGMATAAISVVRQLARKKKTTMLARMLPTTRCSSSEEIAARMKIDWSLLTDAETPAGSAAVRPASLAFTCSATVTLFCPDCFCTMSVTALLPFRNDALRSSSWPSTTSAMSFRRTT